MKQVAYTLKNLAKSNGVFLKAAGIELAEVSGASRTILRNGISKDAIDCNCR